MEAFSIFNKEIDACDGNGAIVFAENQQQAICEFRINYPEYYSSCISELEIKREPIMDQYKNRTIPDLAYARIGWFSQCDVCGEASSGDGFGVHNDKVICHSCFEADPTNSKEVGENSDTLIDTRNGF